MFEVAGAATALFVFGRTGGNIVPETVTITRAVYRRREVKEHGGCNLRFTTLYNALWRAAGAQ